MHHVRALLTNFLCCGTSIIKSLFSSAYIKWIRFTVTPGTASFHLQCHWQNNGRKGYFKLYPVKYTCWKEGFKTNYKQNKKGKEKMPSLKEDLSYCSHRAAVIYIQPFMSAFLTSLSFSEKINFSKCYIDMYYRYF